MLRRNNRVLSTNDNFLSTDNRVLSTDQHGLHDRVFRRLVSRLLGRSSSHTFVGLTDRLCRGLPDRLCSAEHLLVVPGWLRDRLRSRVFELFKLPVVFLVFVAVQHLRVLLAVQLMCIAV
jgi:hypothetical protein